MRWNRKSLLSSLKALGAQIDTIKSPEDAKKFLESKGYSHIEDPDTEKPVDIDRAWKTVYINPIATAGEDVQLGPPPSEPEGEAMDPPEEEEEEVGKSARRAPITARQIQKGFAWNGAPAVHGEGAFSVQRKAYDAKAARGITAFSCGDMAELAGAYFRYQGLQNQEYAQKASDRAILKTALVTFDNSLGGATIPDGFHAELIVNLANFGAAARLSPIFPMGLPKEEIPRLVEGVTMDYTGEGEDTDETNPELDSVTLVSHEIAGQVPVSLRLLNNSAVAIADMLTREFSRAAAKKQDTTYFNGDNKQQGVLTKIGSGTNSTVAITGLSSTGLLGLTMDHIQRLIALVPSYVDESECVFTMSRQAYELTLGRFEINAPGNRRDELRQGPAGGGQYDRIWGGYGVIFNNITRKTYATGTIPILFGAFSRVVKLGSLTGSQFMRSSEHAQFTKRNVVWQAGEEFAVNPHDVNDTAGSDGDATKSGVVGLKTSD